MPVSYSLYIYFPIHHRRSLGILTKSHEKSIDGYEIHFATNYLGHFLLTNLLLDLLKTAPSARIINVSALAHKCKIYLFNRFYIKSNTLQFSIATCIGMILI